MGLDVNLFKCPDAKRALELEERYEQELEALYAHFSALEKKKVVTVADEEELNQTRLNLKKKYGIEDYHHSSIETIHFDSKTQPDHLFKIGYLRSSYNEGGINNVLATFGMPTLYDIFNVTGDGYYQYPNWEEVRKSCLEVIEMFEKYMASPMGKYGITTFRPLLKSGATSSDEALEIFNQELLKYQESVKAHEELVKLNPKRKDFPPFGSYMCKAGNFYLDEPLKVYGVVHHQDNPDAKKWFLAGPATYLIVERDPANNEWYLTALKITLEMIDYVLADPHPEHFFLGWSG